MEVDWLACQPIRGQVGLGNPPPPSSRVLVFFQSCGSHDSTGGSQQVVQRAHEQLQLSEGAAVTAHLRRSALRHVAQVLQLLAARPALLVSGGGERGRRGV